MLHAWVVYSASPYLAELGFASHLSKFNLAGCSKRFVQQGRRRFGARSVRLVREHGKTPRTPLAAFVNILLVTMAITLMGMTMIQLFFCCVPHVQNFYIKIQRDAG